MVAPLQRSLPDVGEFARTELLTAIYRARPPCGEPQARGRMSDSGRDMGAEGRWQPRSQAACVPAQESLTCADEHKQAERSPVCLADTEAAAGSIPVLPARVCWPCPRGDRASHAEACLPRSEP